MTSRLYPNQQATSAVAHQDQQIVQVLSDVDMKAQGGSAQDTISMSQSSMQEEYCPNHGDLYVAFDKKKNELVCNQCIYAEVEDVEKALEQLTFTSYVASNLKDLFDDKFNSYKQSLSQMNKIAPQAISTTLETTVSQFFKNVEGQIKDVESRVLDKIQGSTNLAELEQLLCKEKGSFGLDLEKLYESNRQEIEGHVQKGNYSSVVSKKDHYESLIKQMEQNRDQMGKTVEESQRKIERIMTIKHDPETQQNIGKRLHEIVDSCLEIDIRKGEVSNFKRQKLENDAQRQREAELRNAQAQVDQARKLAADQDALRLRTAAEESRRMAAEEEASRQRAAAEKARVEEQARVAAEARKKQEEEAERQRILNEQQAKQRLIEAERQRQIQLQQQQQEQERQRQAAEQERQRQLEQERIRQERVKELERQRQEQAEKEAEARRLEEVQRQRDAAEAQRQREFAEAEARRQAEVAAEQERQAQISKQQKEEQERQEQARLEKLRQEQAQEQARQEQARQEQLHAQEQARQEQIRQEQARQEQARQEQARQESARQESARQEQERINQERISQQQVLESYLAQPHTAPQEQVQQPHVVVDDRIIEIPNVQTNDSNNNVPMQESAANEPVVVMNVNEDMQFHNQMDVDSNDHQMVDLIDSVPQSNVVQDVQSENNAPIEVVHEPAAPVESQPEPVMQAPSAAPEIVEVQPVQIQQQQPPQPAVEVQVGPLQAEPNHYAAFHTQKSMKIFKSTPDANLNFKRDEVYSIQNQSYLNRVVALPGNRVFVIGGSSDIRSTQVHNTTYELVDGELHQKTGMWTSRAAFGCAVYPNFSQIFIAGGSTGPDEATRHCERYIVSTNQWKRLPELREAKFSTSLCFFNNGGTLYCFGGLLKTGHGQFRPSASIERLSKGQNSWCLLNLKMPMPYFDMGCLQVSSDEIALFGGFDDGALDRVLYYKTNPEDGSFREGQKLKTRDFFVVNGMYIKAPNADGKQLIFAGHNSIHHYDMDKKEFKSLPIQ